MGRSAQSGIAVNHDALKACTQTVAVWVVLAPNRLVDVKMIKKTSVTVFALCQLERGGSD